VQTKPHFLTSEAQAHRYFGTAAKTKLVSGTALAAETGLPRRERKHKRRRAMGAARVLLDQKRRGPQRDIPWPS
jgi:hypothetical protein